MQEVNKAMRAFKIRKAAGIDEVAHEAVKNGCVTGCENWVIEHLKIEHHSKIGRTKW